MKPALLFLILSLSSCGRKESTSSQANPANSTQEITTAAEQDPNSIPPPRAPMEAAPPDDGKVKAAQPIEGMVDAFLTSQLRQFVQEKGRLPETFAEFAGARLDSVPRLPRGLHFEIDRTTQEVKVTKQ